MEENKKYVPDSKDKEPRFVRDLLPQFQAIGVMILSYLVFAYTGNMAIVMYVINVIRPLYDVFFLDDKTNVSKVNEKSFMNYWMYKIPLYSYILTNLLINIWMMAIWSDKYKPEHWLFNIDVGNNAMCVFHHLTL